MTAQTAVGPEQPDTTGRPPRRRRLLLLGTIVLVTIGVAGAFAVRGHPTGGVAAADAKAAASWSRPVVTEQGLAQASGVRLVRVAISGDGGLLDLRFQVLDPELAGRLHDTVTPPALVDEASGLVVESLLMGHAHSDPFHVGTTYYLVFENSAGWVHRGSRVSVLLGPAQVDHVVVA